MEQATIVGAVVLFLAFLLWNSVIRAPLRRGARERLTDPEGADDELQKLLSQLREGAKTGPILRKIKKRIADEPSSHIRAVYLCAIGDVLRQTVSRRGTALRHYIKALEQNPACVGARHGMRDILLAQRRGFRLEQLYWKLLGRLDFEEHGCECVTEAWEELTELLRRRHSGRSRAKALRRLLERITESPECEEETPPSGNCC